MNNRYDELIEIFEKIPNVSKEAGISTEEFTKIVVDFMEYLKKYEFNECFDLIDQNPNLSW